jgi:hypothetical protein
LEYLHKAGLVSTEEYERKKFEIELKWAQMKREMEESTLQYEMNTHTARINKAEQNQPKLAQDVNAKTTAYEQAHVTAVQAAKDRVTTEEQAKAAKDTWEKFNRDHPTHAANFERLGVNATDEQIEQDRWSHSQSYGFDWTDVGVVESYKKWRKAKIDNDQLNGRAAEDGKPAIKAAVVTSIETEARTAAAAAKAKIDLETAQKRETENKAFVVSGRQDVAAKDDQLAALQAQNAQIKAVEEAVLKQQRQTTQLDSPSMGTIMRAFDELRAGHRDPQARQVEADAENILHHMGYTDLQIGNMIRQILKSVQDRDRVIDDLQKQVERLNQRY